MANQEKVNIKYDENGNFIADKHLLEIAKGEINEEPTEMRYYCCTYNNDKDDKYQLRAKNTTEATIQCMLHRPLQPVSISKGRCDD